MLTTKQEKFVQELIKGETQRQAYINAGYKVENMTDEVIDVKASELLKNGKVLVRYKELIDKSADEALWTREQAVKDLVMIKDEAINHLKREVNTDNGNTISFIDNKMAKVATDAIKELNTMYGYNEHNINNENSGTFDVNIKVI